MEKGGRVRLQLLVNIDLGAEISPEGIVGAFDEAIQQVAYTYGNRGSRQYIGDTACVWYCLGGAALSRAEGKSWQSTAMLTNDNNKNIWEENK